MLGAEYFFQIRHNSEKITLLMKMQPNIGELQFCLWVSKVFKEGPVVCLILLLQILLLMHLLKYLLLVMIKSKSITVFHCFQIFIILLHIC